MIYYTAAGENNIAEFYVPFAMFRCDLFSAVWPIFPLQTGKTRGPEWDSAGACGPFRLFQIITFYG
ncbi:MAG: hypothetical protein ACOX41_03840 [Anaerovoracaceae bacterium]|jgi:hypothetical protein